VITDPLLLLVGRGSTKYAPTPQVLAPVMYHAPSSSYVLFRCFEYIEAPSLNDGRPLRSERHIHWTRLCSIGWRSYMQACQRAGLT
jgi:hypothetical protein